MSTPCIYFVISEIIAYLKVQQQYFLLSVLIIRRKKLCKFINVDICVFTFFFFPQENTVFYVQLESQKKIFGSPTFSIKLSIIQDYLFLQYLISKKYTDMIAFPAQKYILMMHSNNSNTLGNTVNKYVNKNGSVI